jgi:hypothetical protein
MSAPARSQETTVFDQLDELIREHAELETVLADPTVHGDQNSVTT